MILIRSISELLVHRSQKVVRPLLRRGNRLFTTEPTNSVFEDLNAYNRIADDTLDSLSQKLEELVEAQAEFPDADISLSSGVLTLQLSPFGTYVLNKQTPNRQIWLSSPISGPKRYDFLRNTWVYKHDNSLLHKLLGEELSEIMKVPVSLSECDYGKEQKE